MKPFINCDGCCDYCLATECDYRKTESLTYATTEPIKTEDKQMKKNKDNFIAAVEKAKQRLAAGENFKDVFHWSGEYHEGLSAVKLNDKWNYIDHEGNILSDKWFDECWGFHEGFALVKLNGRCYLLHKDGVLYDFDTKEPVEPDHSVSMDYKKKYEEALQRARVVNPGTADHNIVTAIFPELQESDENKIIDALKVAVHAYCSTDHNYVTTIPKDQLIAWLEKQGELVKSLSKGLDNAHERIDGLIQKNNSLIEQLEKQGKQKSTDKTEPKFKVGDWITNYRNVWCIETIHDGRYDLKDTHGCVMKNLKSKTIDDKFHLWTIRDAKNGDVLVASDDSIFILKEIVDYGCKYYIAITKDGKTIYVNDNFKHRWEHACYVKPATNEQRDLLFSKMKEAGYEWDTEKKELKKIEQEDDSELTDFESALFSAFSDAWQEYLSGKTVNIAKWTREHSAELLEVAREQKPIDWSEEDESMLQKTLSTIRYALSIPFNKEDDPCFIGSSSISWLKSLKERLKL